MEMIISTLLTLGIIPIAVMLTFKYYDWRRARAIRKIYMSDNKGRL